MHTNAVLHHAPTMEAAEKRRTKFVDGQLDRRVRIGGDLSILQVRKLLTDAYAAGFSDGVHTTCDRANSAGAVS
jgi:hypothetical protein